MEELEARGWELEGLEKGMRHIHLSGICGTAMASLAGLLQLQGHRITGSDKAAYPPMSDLLRGLGIPVMEPYAEANLEPKPDLVVIGNALSRGNPEVERVLDERIPFTSMAALLREEFLAGRESLVVAGTHGKTTTTSIWHGSTRLPHASKWPHAIRLPHAGKWLHAGKQPRARRRRWSLRF